MTEILEWVVPGLITGFVTLLGVLLADWLRERSRRRVEDLSLYRSVHGPLIKLSGPDDPTKKSTNDFDLINESFFRKDVERGRFPSHLKGLKDDIEQFERLKKDLEECFKSLNASPGDGATETWDSCYVLRKAFLEHAQSMKNELKACVESQARRKYRSKL